VTAHLPGALGITQLAASAYCGGMANEQPVPVIRQTVLDTTDPRRLAEFYRQLFGLRYRPGDEPPALGQPDPAGHPFCIIAADGPLTSSS
jgi:hypothetical protein